MRPGPNLTRRNAIGLLAKATGGTLLAACAPTPRAASTTSVAPAVPTPLPPTPITLVDLDVGAPPPEGWRWLVAELSGNSIAESPGHGLQSQGHGFFWLFFVVKGSTEIVTAEGTKVASARQGILNPARQPHTHRYAPDSAVLALDVRSANDNPKEFHGGTRLYLSDKIALRSAASHKLRIQELTLSPGQRLAEAALTDPTIAYVVEGALSAGSVSIEAGKVGELAVGTKIALSNQGSAPLRLYLLDVRP